MNIPAMLAAARELIEEPVEETQTVWPLGAAVLTRQAIETTVNAYWRTRLKSMLGATWSDKFVALPFYLRTHPAEIGEAAYAWRMLSDACHQRDYDVGLTQAELLAHVAAAEAFMKVVGNALKKP